MQSAGKIGVGLVMLAGALAWQGAAAQEAAVPRNVVQLSAQGSVEVPQDLLQMTLTATQEGSDAGAVQQQLQRLLDAGLATAKSQARQAQDGGMEVRSGSFGVYPRSDKNGKITGWQGRAELQLQGKDFARISQVAARIEGMPVSRLAFGLSKEARAKVEGEAQAQAIADFKARAQSLAGSFGFAGYTLREISVNSNQQELMPMARAGAMMAMAKSADAAPVPVEAGKAQVVVHVSGSVQLQ